MEEGKQATSKYGLEQTISSGPFAANHQHWTTSGEPFAANHQQWTASGVPQ